jgi:hypothetical protein
MLWPGNPPDRRAFGRKILGHGVKPADSAETGTVPAPRGRRCPRWAGAAERNTVTLHGAMAYRIMLGIVLTTLAVLLFFFLWGVSDGTVSAFNIVTWLVALGLPGAVLAGGLALRRSGRPGSATLLLALIAVPAALTGLFFLLLILLQPDWT